MVAEKISIILLFVTLIIVDFGLVLMPLNEEEEERYYTGNRD